MISKFQEFEEFDECITEKWKILSCCYFIDFLEHVANMAPFFFSHCRFCARVYFRREGKERRKERDGDVPREMEGTNAPGTIISPGEENGERDP